MAHSQRKVPMRMCLGCRERKEKRALVRVVRSPEGEVNVDLTGKKPGRGAYVCSNQDCLGKAVKSKALERSLSISISPEIHEQLSKEVQ